MWVGPRPASRRPHHREQRPQRITEQVPRVGATSAAARHRSRTTCGATPALASIVVVTIPSDVSSLVVRKSITVARQTKAPVLGVIENMAGLFPGAGGEQLAIESGVPFLGRVPFDAGLAAAADRGEPYVPSAPETPAARALVGIAADLRATLAAARA